jgi:hypothetical protein
MFCTGWHVQNAEGKWSHANDPLQVCPQYIALRRAGVVGRHSLVGLSPPASRRVRQARSTDAIMGAGYLSFLDLRNRESARAQRFLRWQTLMMVERGGWLEEPTALFPERDRLRPSCH